MTQEQILLKACEEYTECVDNLLKNEDGKKKTFEEKKDEWLASLTHLVQHHVFEKFEEFYHQQQDELRANKKMSETPETLEAWNAAEQLPTNTYSKCGFTQNLAIAMFKHSKKMEIERNEWKAKFVQQNLDLGHELRDPNGTIWDECEKLQKENTMLTAKLARIQKLITHPDPYWAIEEIERAVNDF